MSREPRPYDSEDSGSTGTVVIDEPPVEREPPRRKLRGGDPPRRRGKGWDHGGGGGDPWGRDGEPLDGEPARQPLSKGEFGFALAMSSVGALFLVFVIGYVVLRRATQVWPPADAPRPPVGLWISCAVLLLTSWALVRGLRAQRAGDVRGLRAWLWRSLALGLAFLLVQGWLWGGLLGAGLSISSNAYGAVFYTLTGLHGAHVAGGMAFLAYILKRMRAASERSLSELPLGLCALYWHGMAGLWALIFVLLYF